MQQVQKLKGQGISRVTCQDQTTSGHGIHSCLPGECTGALSQDKNVNYQDTLQATYFQHLFNSRQ